MSLSKKPVSLEGKEISPEGTAAYELMGRMDDCIY